MKKSIFLFFAAILCAIGASAATKTIYFKSQQWWHKDNAASAAYYWGTGGNANDWPGTRMTKVAGETNMWSIEIDTDKYQNIIFTRVNGSGTVQDWGAKTTDQAIPTDDKNFFTLGNSEVWGDPGATGTWSTYTPPTEPVIPDYYIAGNTAFVGANSWEDGNAAHDALKMVYSETNKNWTITISNVAANAQCEFKINDGTWDTSWGISAVNPKPEGVTGSDNILFTLSTAGDVTVTFDGTNIQLTTTSSFTPVETFDYYVVGNFNGWNTADPAYGMTKDGDVYKKEVTFAAAVQFKVCDGTWGANWGANNLGDNTYKELGGTDNLEMKEEKTFTIIFNPAQNLLTFEGLTAEAVVTYDYYIAGTLAGGWSSKQQGMEKDGELYKHTFSELAAGTYEFKITDGQWNSEGDATHEHTTLGAAYEEVSYNEGNIKIDTDEAINLTVIFDATADKITFEGLTEITEGLTYTVKTPWGTENCYIASATTDWNFRQMDPTDENRVFTITIVGAKETDEYKYACQPEWDFAEVREADENGNTNRKAWAEKDTVDLWGTRTYTVAGSNTDVFGTEWDAENWDNDMTLQDDGTYVWTKSAVYLTDDVQFKVVKNQNWATAWPADNYVVDITEEAYYSLTIYYNPANNDITVVTNKLTVQTGSLTVDGVMLEEMDYDGINLLSLTGQTSDWTTGVTIFLENYTGEDKAYDVHYDSSIDWNYSYSSSVSGQLTQTTGADGIRTFTGVLDVVFEAYDEATDAMVGQPYELTVTLVEKTDEATLVVVTDATVTLEAGLTMTGEWTDEYDGTTYPVLVTVPGFDQSVASAELDASITVGGEGEDDPWLGWVEGPITVTVEEDVVTVTGVLENVWAGVKLDVTISGTLPVVEEPEPDPDPTPDPEETPDYTRTVGNNQFGTICLPFGGTITGAVLYECVGKEEGKVYLGSVTTLTAGVPYIFQATATATELAVYSDGGTTATTAGSSNGLHGTFEDETEVAAGNYILLGNTLYPSDGEAKVNANRAYLDMSGVPAGVPTQMPGRRYIGMSVQGENGATGVEDLFTTDAPVKVIENGQLIIIRDGVKYNVQGQVIR